MTRHRILCEGPDDLAALRELLLTRHFKLKKRPAPAGSTEKRTELQRDGDRGTWEIVIAGSDEQVLIRAADTQNYGSPSDPVTRIVLSFDPNGRPDWRAWFENGLKSLAPTRTGDEYHVKTPLGNTAIIMPMPWLLSTPLYYGLPDKHCLERIVVHAFASEFPKENDAIGRWLAEFPALGQKSSWKAAARLWNGLMLPDVVQGLMDKVFGQDHRLGARIVTTLTATDIWKALGWFAEAIEP